MPRYPEERRQAVVAKLLPPYNQSVEEVARQEGISSATIYKWRKEARAEGRCLPDAGDQGVEGWSSRDKFAAVVETAGSLHSGGPDVESAGLIRLHCPKRRLQLVKKGEKC
jgi:transposase-like protein